MNKAEVFELMAKIKQRYCFFDTSDDQADDFVKYLSDVPFELALRNLEKHIQTSEHEPKIAHLRAGIGDQRERMRSLEDTAKHFDQLEEYRRNAVPPPQGNKAKILAILQGGESG